MISILECNDNIDDIAKTHNDFIVKSISPIVDFYLEVYNIKNSLTNYSRNNTIIENIKKIPGIHGNTKRSLLSILFTKKKEIEKLNDSWKIKRTNLLSIQARNVNQILASLTFLSNNLNEIVSLNLNEIYSLNSALYNTYRVNLNPINFLLEKIFNYDWFISLNLDEDWNSYKLTEALGIKVCPYCNRQRTFTVKNNTDKITKPELDHFLPKKQHPLLALSFYNLIPSCTVCNRDLKGEIPFSYDTHLSPYEENKKHELIKYDYLPMSYGGAAGLSEDIKIQIKYLEGVSSNLKRKIEGNISVFKYEDISDNLTDIVQEIIYKRYISGDDYIKILKKTFPKANLTYEEAYRIAYGNYYNEKDFAKRPLSKMTKDIAYHIDSLKEFI
ncbi:HNH endonuclease [Tenacibaculum maritimum]|uniref:HNH endonuclease n=1 Tax=Tenacibaculum maritimum TaxID=107401 RepID=UPI0012E6CB10|nr:hypothetical protein [Tenacibaculum maritimum]CAA0205437.1 conserved hypothetical protein [Tenacibaculum maritimum]